jgi:hypothetical protein
MKASTGGNSELGILTPTRTDKHGQTVEVKLPDWRLRDNERKNIIRDSDSIRERVFQ